MVQEKLCCKKLGYPVFDADFEVSKLYSKNKKIFIKLNKVYPNIYLLFQLIKTKLSKLF